MNPLRRLRFDAGLSAKRLGELSGVKPQVISYVENGGGSSPENLKALADVLTEQLGRDVVASDLLAVAA